MHMSTCLSMYIPLHSMHTKISSGRMRSAGRSPLSMRLHMEQLSDVSAAAHIPLFGRQNMCDNIATSYNLPVM